MQCANVYKDSFKKRIFRETDDSPAYEEIVNYIHCEREEGHGGDHTGRKEPRTIYSDVYIWPPAGYIDERTLI